MIYEMRYYFVARGRMDDNHARQRDHLPALFDMHGIRVVGRWTALAGLRLPTFVYITEWRDFSEREAAWASFYADPEWADIRARTNAGAEMITGMDVLFLRPNSVSKPQHTDAPAGAVQQLLLQPTLIGRTSDVSAFLQTQYLPLIAQGGGQLIGLWDVLSGATMPTLAILVSWPDARSWHLAWGAIENDSGMNAAFSQQFERFGGPLLGPSESILLEPASYGQMTFLRHDSL